MIINHSCQINKPFSNGDVLAGRPADQQPRQVLGALQLALLDLVGLEQPLPVRDLGQVGPRPRFALHGLGQPLLSCFEVALVPAVDDGHDGDVVVAQAEGLEALGDVLAARGQVEGDLGAQGPVVIKVKDRVAKMPTALLYLVVMVPFLLAASALTAAHVTCVGCATR